MKKSSNLSKKTTVAVTQKKSSAQSKKSSTGSGKTSKSKSSGKRSSTKKSSVPRSSKSAGLKLSPVTALKSTKKPSHSNRNIGIQAAGKMIKTLYGLTEGKEGAEEHAALKAGLKQIQNLTNKRINKLVQLEAETGLTSPALKKLRETGYAQGVSVKRFGTDTDTLREQYKAMLDFLKDKTSTKEGVTRNMIEIEQDLRDAGWRPEGEEGPVVHDEEGHVIWDRLNPNLSADQYEKFKALANVFYDEQAKYKFYLMLGTHDQETIQNQIGQEIVELMDKGDLDTVLFMAEQRLNEIYQANAKKLFT